jgi:hypothetical protein
MLLGTVTCGRITLVGDYDSLTGNIPWIPYRPYTPRRYWGKRSTGD